MLFVFLTEDSTQCLCKQNFVRDTILKLPEQQTKQNKTHALPHQVTKLIKNDITALNDILSFSNGIYNIDKSLKKARSF
jgi:hypothetical protein